MRALAITIRLLLLVTPLIVIRDAKEAFRLGQVLVAGWLGLASLIVAAFGLRGQATVSLTALARRPVVRALAPLALLVMVSGATTTHGAHYRAAAADFAIGVACLVGWTLALDAQTLRALLRWTVPPATLVAALAIDQSTGWFGALDWLQVDAETSRLALTSTVGNPGDIAALLVLPLLVTLDDWRTTRGEWRPLRAAAAMTMAGALALTATIAAVGALAAGAAVWGWCGTAQGHGRRARLLTASVVLAAACLTMFVVTPLRDRVIEKVSQLAHGDVNAALTGRLDGWRAAVDMLRRQPVTGVGYGGFRTAFAQTRLDLAARGVEFYPEQHQVMMATPHNEALSVAAELGVAGLVAVAWAVWSLGVALRRIRDGERRALAWSGASALGVLSLVWFPLHVAATAWPWLLFLAWTFREAEEAA
jgi:O-antigen ligase